MPLTCALSLAGPGAFAEGLRDVFGFEIATVDRLAEAVRAGQPVIVHGWWWNQYRPLLDGPGRLHVVWHSGWYGSDLMDEGATLAPILEGLMNRRFGVFWVEERDVLPPGAQSLSAVWSPRALRALAAPRPKRPNSIAVALGTSRAKALWTNVVAAAAAAAATGGEVHLPEAALAAPYGAVTYQLLGDWKTPVVIRPATDRRAAAGFIAEAEVLAHVSATETWPYALLEAVYAETPVVTAPFVPWVGRLSPEAQRLCVVQPKDTSRLRDVLVALLRHPDERAALVAEQARVLDALAVEHAASAERSLRAAGFEVTTCST